MQAFVSESMSKKILEQAQAQQKELEQEASGTKAAVFKGSGAGGKAWKRSVGISSLSLKKSKSREELDEEAEMKEQEELLNPDLDDIEEIVSTVVPHAHAPFTLFRGLLFCL